jgi:hypothetical protein
MKMNAPPRGQRARPLAAWARAPLVLAGAVGLVAVTGCGTSSGSTTPAYCADRARLQKSVKGLTSLNPAAGLSGLQAQVDNLKSSADAAANSAMSAFPSQTRALKSSVDALDSAVKALAASPSSANIGNVTTDAENVLASVKNFTDATSSKCS